MDYKQIDVQRMSKRELGDFLIRHKETFERKDLKATLRERCQRVLQQQIESQDIREAKYSKIEADELLALLLDRIKALEAKVADLQSDLESVRQSGYDTDY